MNYLVTFDDGRQAYLSHGDISGTTLAQEPPMYIVTFEDGSSACLTHYGVLGMKWGVRNAETLARYARGKFHDAKNEFLDTIGMGGGWIKENEEEEEEHPDIWEKKTRETPPEYDMYEINPFFNEGYNINNELLNGGKGDTTKVGALVNCATCSIVYDLRRRGYDVSANTTTNMAWQVNTGLLSDYYQDAKPVENAYEDTLASIRDYPDGARGTFSGQVNNGGGHCIAWEKRNGKVSYYDCQSSTKYTEENLSKLFDTTQITFHSRLDDKTPNLRRMRTDGLVSTMNKSERDRQNAIDSSVVEKKHQEDWRAHEKGTFKIINRQLVKIGKYITDALFGR